MIFKKALFQILSILLFLNTWSVGEAAPEKKARKAQYSKNGVPKSAPRDVVDRVAYSYQKKAITKLRRLLKKKSQKAGEPNIMIRLARLEQKTADIAFRVAHEEAYKKKKPINLSHYRKLLKSTTRTWTQFIQKFPNRKELPQGYLGRAQAYEGLEDKQRAYQDYLSITRRFSNFKEIDKIYLILAEYSSEAKNPVNTIKFLRKIKNRKSDRNYGYILSKLAWAFYDTRKIKNAMFYVDEYSRFYRRMFVQSKRNNDSNMRMLLSNNLFVDSSKMYLTGIEKGMKGYSISGAYKRFNRLAIKSGNSKNFDAMAVHFAKLLRVKRYDGQLLAWRDLIVKKRGASRVTQDVTILVYEHQFNRKKYRDLIRSANFLAKLYQQSKNKESFKWTKEFLGHSTVKVSKYIIKNQGSERARKLNSVLIALYKSLLVISKDDEKFTFGIRYNLAQALSGMKKHSKALKQYLWVYKKGRDDPKLAESAKVSYADAGLSAVSIRYKEFRDNKIFPIAVTPKPIDSPAGQKMSPTLNEWIEWVNQLKELKDEKKFAHKDLNLYWFEANRAIYAYGDRNQAVKNLEAFARKNPNSKYATASASLVIDTLIASKKWENANELASSLKKYKGLNKKGFGERLSQVSADTNYKMTEDLFNEKKYTDVIANAPKHEKIFEKSFRRLDWLNLVARSAVAVKKEALASRYLSEIINTGQGTRYYLEALLLRSQIHENGLNFSRARKDIALYLKLAESQKYFGKVKLAKKALLYKKYAFLAWIQGKYKELRGIVRNPSFCKTYPIDCDQYDAVVQFAFLDIKKEHRGRNVASKKVFEKNAEAGKTLWALLNLEQDQSKWKKNQISNKFNLIQSVGDGWSSLDPLVSFVLIKRVLRVIPESFENLRDLIRRSTKIKAEQSVIKSRLELIQKSEILATQLVASLPWIEIHKKILSEVAGMYEDISEDILGLAKVSGLSAEESSAIGQTMVEVAQPFVEVSEKLRTKISQMDLKESQADIGVSLLSQVDPDGNWIGGGRDIKNRLKGTFYKAVQKNNIVKAAFLIQIAEERKLVSSSLLTVMRAVVLAKNDAKAEAVLELKKIGKLDMVLSVAPGGLN